MNRRKLWTAVLLGLGVALARSAEVVPGQFDSLIRNSPFGQPAPASGPQTGNGAAPLEFRGVFVDRGEYFFSLHETANRASQWVGLNEASQPYVVESYDQAKGSIQVKYRDQTMTLTLKLAQIIVQAVPSSAPPPAVLPSGSALANQAPGDVAGRLAQVAEEIRRRRALRAPGLVPQQNAPGNPPRPGPLPTKP